MINQHVNNIITGLQLLNNKYNVYTCAYNGELWCKYSSKNETSSEDASVLKSLGWKHNNVPLAWWIEV